jgi:DNA helicase-2/ATP-dependent DNA helicase PcrA
MLHGQVNYGMASSFLRELPDNLLHWLTPRIAQRNTFSSFGYSAPSAPLRSPSPEREQPRNSPWRIGQTVFHSKFGEGVIVNLEGSGADARVQVNFRKAAVKWLALEYAKLVVV